MTQADAPPKATARDIDRFWRNYRDEADGAALYQLLSEAEKDAGLASVYARMAKSEERHLALWEAKLAEFGVTVTNRKPSRRVRFLGWIARRFGTGAVAPIISRMELAATTMYDDQPEAIAAGLHSDERSHARLVRAIERSPGTDTVRQIARLEGRHRGGAGAGNALRAAVLGVNDGLVSTLSLVLGVAGADPGRDVVLVTGIAGLLAGAFSMALGEWISVKSSREAFDRQMAIEKEELELMPEEEEEELVLIYKAKGLSEPVARESAKRIMSNHVTALDTLAREELGMSEEEAGNPMVAAGTSFLLFSMGSILPVMPWFFTGGASAILLSAIVAGAGLFLAGAATTLFTGRSVLFSGGRMLVIGLSAAFITYGIGRAIGAGTGI